MTNEREEEEEEEEENILLSSAYVERILNFVAASIVSVRVAEWITLVITIDPVALSPLSPSLESTSRITFDRERYDNFWYHDIYR